MKAWQIYKTGICLKSWFQWKNCTSAETPHHRLLPWSRLRNDTRPWSSCHDLGADLGCHRLERNPNETMVFPKRKWLNILIDQESEFLGKQMAQLDVLMVLCFDLYGAIHHTESLSEKPLVLEDCVFFCSCPTFQKWWQTIVKRNDGKHPFLAPRSLNFRSFKIGSLGSGRSGSPRHHCIGWCKRRWRAGGVSTCSRGRGLSPGSDLFYES